MSSPPNVALLSSSGVPKVNEPESSTPSTGSTTPRRPIPSFENLQILANWRENQEKLRSARKILWRDRGEPVVMLDSVEDCVRHALKGGARAFGLAASIRAVFNLCLALIRIGSIPREKRLRLIQHALFGEDTWRFGAMLGTFVSLYKFILNSLPILIPALQHHDLVSPFGDDQDDDDEEPLTINTSRKLGRKKAMTLPPVLPSTDPRAQDAQTLEVPLTTHRSRDGRLSLSATAQLSIVRKKTRRWHSVLAGFLAGAFGVAWEKKARRTALGQQMFVRGLQGQYNAYSTKHNIHIPHGDIIVFSLACGQIMYAWLMRPDTIPISYSNWICSAAHVPREAPPINLAMFRGRAPNISLIDKVMARPDITPYNLSELQKLKADSIALLSGQSDTKLYGHLPCAAVHPWEDSCFDLEFAKFFTVARWMLPVYSALHFVPAILFKRKKFMKEPLQVLTRAGWGSLRSSAFLGAYVVIYHSLFCGQYQLYAKLVPLKIFPKWLLDILVSRFSFWFPGALTGFSLFLEAKHRRGELAMYVLPKALESVWRIATGKVRGLAGVKKTGDKGIGNILLMAIAMGMTMGTYQNDPQHLSGLVRRILYQFIGPN